jgi:hypothetical protein
VPAEWNFRLRLRLQVLAEVAVRLPRTILARRDITSRSTTPRTTTWHTWTNT